MAEFPGHALFAAGQLFFKLHMLLMQRVALPKNVSEGVLGLKEGVGSGVDVRSTQHEGRVYVK